MDISKIRKSTRRLLIRAMEASDYRRWMEAHLSRRPKTYRYDNGPPADSSGLTKARFKKIIRGHRDFARRDETYVFGVFLKSTGQHIGYLELNTIQRQNTNWANLGYMVHNAFHRKGYGKEFVKAGLRLGFDQLKYKRIEATIPRDNRPSIKLAQSAGMAFECIRREFYFNDGKWVDLEVHVAISKTRRPHR